MHQNINVQTNLADGPHIECLYVISILIEIVLYLIWLVALYLKLTLCDETTVVLVALPHTMHLLK